MIRDNFLMDWIYSSQIRPNLSNFDYRVTGIAYVTVPADPNARVPVVLSTVQLVGNMPLIPSGIPTVYLMACLKNSFY